MNESSLQMELKNCEETEDKEFKTNVEDEILKSYFSSYNKLSNIPLRVNIKKTFANQNVNNYDDDMMELFDRNCFYFPSFFTENINIYQYLKRDVSFAFNTNYKSFKATNMGRKHDTLIMYDNYKNNDNDHYTLSITYNMIMNIVINYFNVEVVHGVLNHYSNQNEYVPFHSDYYYKGMDMTIGVGFGQQRIFQFSPSNSLDENQILSIPQRNGDLFAFTKIVNDNFKHRIPMELNKKCGPKFSVILFVKRKNLNERNSSLEERRNANKKTNK